MQFDPLFIERLIQHDDLAFAQFYEQSADVFFRYIMTHYSLSEQECHDILSDVYLKIRQNIDKYDEKYTFWQYVRTILKNHCKDYFKKMKPLFFSDLTTEDGTSMIENHPHVSRDGEEEDMTKLLQQKYTFEHITAALESLDEESQQLIHAKYVLHYNYDIIADLYSLNNATVRQKISRIIKKLKQKLWFLSE